MSMSKRAYEASEEREDRMREHAEELYYSLWFLLNDCINFDGGKLTDSIMARASRVLDKIDGRQP